MAQNVMNKMIQIHIANDFSPTPGGRYITDGPYSGEEFRDKFLIPKLHESDQLLIILDGARGYPSSFLDEAFAGLVKEKGWSAGEFNEHIVIRGSGSYEIYVRDIVSYVKEAAS